MRQRIGILGGTFNPVHLGHLVMAQDALEHVGLDRVLFIPASTPPHKIGANVVPADHRLTMLRLAVEGDDRFDVSEEEIRRQGVSYTIDTVCRLQELNPDATLHFIIGSDTLRELHTWKDIDRLLDCCEFVTVARPGFPVNSITRELTNLKDPWPARLAASVVIGHPVEISSTDIRNACARGRSIRYLVPAAVERYIRDTGLYSNR
jgi:nicotinate-nucleotide adenylyltransferase